MLIFPNTLHSPIGLTNDMVSISNNAVILLTARVALELVQRKNLGKLCRPETNALEVAHGSCAGYMILRSAPGSGNRITERGNNCSDKSAGNTVVAREERVFFKEALTAAAPVAALTQVQKRSAFGSHGYGLSRLHRQGNGVFAWVIPDKYEVRQKYFQHL